MANRILVSSQGDDEADGECLAREAGVVSFMQKICRLLNLDGEEVSVSFCTDNAIKALNKQYRGIDEATDVLSFEDGGEYTDEDGCLWRNMGDIVISYETLHRAEAEVGEKEDEELKRLCVHGLLHLNGYDHGSEHLVKGKMPVCPMLVLQERLLLEADSE